MKSLLTVVLGAPDVEAAKIEELVQTVGANVFFAGWKGKRVSADTAYVSDTILNRFGAKVHPRDLLGEVLLVECGGPGLDQCLVCFATASGRGDGLAAANHIGETCEEHRWPTGRPGGPHRIDHHRAGDPGHGLTPEQFLRASSIGQIMDYLARTDRLPDWKRAYPQPQGLRLCTRHLALMDEDTWLIARHAIEGTSWYVIPQDYVFTAAADHCLAAAYAGRCSGVRPDDLMTWRIAQKASFQKRPPAAILAQVEKARTILRDAFQRSLGYADLRGANVPELPEAAAREGIPFLASLNNKVVLQAAPPALVRRFLAGEVVPGLERMYGDPERGFAGGYLATD